MKEGDIILTPLPQANGPAKNRPALLLRELPPFGDYLACGISTQLHQAVPEFDDVISKADADFSRSGLLAASVIRLGFLAVLPSRRIVGAIGRVAPERHARLLRTLSRHLIANLPTSRRRVRADARPSTASFEEVTMSPSPIDRVCFDAATLHREHPPQWHHANKQLVYEIGCSSGTGHKQQI